MRALLRGRAIITGILALLLTALALVVAVPASHAADSTGTLSLQSADPVPGQQVRFTYQTDAPDDSNWIALYDNPADGPTDQKYHSASTVWARATGTSGTLTLSTAKLGSGHAITAYFLAKDGYQWLAKPVTFTLKAGPVNGTLTLANAAPTVGDDLTFTYQTDRPSDLNWVGIYDNPASGPADGKYHGGSTVWRRATGTSGTVSIPSTALTTGHAITAYFLYADRYESLATPVTFTLTALPPSDGSPQHPALGHRRLHRAHGAPRRQRQGSAGRFVAQCRR